MKKSRIVVAILISFLMISMPLFNTNIEAEGLSMTIYVGPANPVVGQKVIVEIGIDRAINVENYDMTLSYTPNIFQFLSDSSNNRNLAPGQAGDFFGVEKYDSDKIIILAQLDPKAS